MNRWALAGRWALEPESVVLEQAGGSIAFRFAARDAHLVLSSGAREPIPFRVLIDGEAPAPHTASTSTRTATAAFATAPVPAVRQHDGVRQRTLQITFLEPDAEAYSFTFG